MRNRFIACLLGFGLLLSCGWAQADIQSGLQWLAGTAQSNGSFASSSGLATPFQSTSESLRTLAGTTVASNASTSAALTFAGNEAYHNTENLSRMIIADSNAGLDVSALTSELYSHQDLVSGGFGELPGYQPTVLDTAFALDALATSGNLNSPSIVAAVAYLENSQSGDGSWSDNGNASSVYLTALAMHAVWSTRQITNTSVIQNATNWLLAQRDSTGSWLQTYQSAEALIALSPALTDHSLIQKSLTTLQAQQLADGSFGEDSYVTALALRAILLGGQSSPDAGAVLGNVVDGQTGQPLGGASVVLTGLQVYATVTAADGTFSITNINPGSYSIQIAASGFGTVSGSATLSTGEKLNLGTVTLVPGSGAGGGISTTGTINGVITDATTGLPIVGATVTTGSQSSLTASDGSYEIANVPAGAVTVSFLASGYQPAATSGEVLAGGILHVSAQLASGSVVAGVQGTITDAVTGQPIAGATVSATSNSASATTNINGAYALLGLDRSSPAVQLLATATGYDPVSTSVQLIGGGSVEFSPKLYPAGTSPVGANTATITGMVVDSTNNHPLAGVSVTANGQSALTDSSGAFRIGGLSTSPVSLSFSLAKYTSTSFTTSIPPVVATNIGQIRLRPQGVTSLLPDLTASGIDAKSHAHSDPRTFVLSGSVQATIGNSGTAASDNGFSALAFYDVDQDGRYESGTDILLGTAQVAESIAVGQSVAVQIPVGGALPFRDAPVSVMVDSNNNVLESDEINNVASSESTCVSQSHTSSTLNPVIKWAWSGGTIAQQYDQVMMAPLVMRVHDDNGDGVIDQKDSPDVIFVAYSGYRADFVNSGILRIVRGIDGADIAAVTDPNYAIPSYANLAAGDIDGDGYPEIIAPKGGGGLIAFAHDGTPKWTISFPFKGGRDWDFGAPAIADINGDGHPVIIFGGYVVSGSGQLLWSTANGYIGGSHPNGSGGIAVDLNNDGRPAVLFGASAFSATGQLLWQNDTVGDGLDAVGQFNPADPYAEIVVVGHGKVSLLDHTGNLIWGPVPLPGGGIGGAPIVADLDGDGIPEIGVAGMSNYVVFNADGSVKWTNVTHDYTSNCTSSTVFDFFNDGKREIVYADEWYLHVYNGADGTPMLNNSSTPGLDGVINTNGTAYDMPVIADLDGDNHADLIVISNVYNGYYPYTTAGIRVFRASDNSWANTRQVFNQLSYHINNVNDDGSIPVHESASWRTHNTYRLNTFLNQNPSALVDLTVGRAAVVDNGSGLPVTITARVGNGGGLPSPATTVTFYNGDPANGGTVIGSVAVGSLSPSSFQDVQLPGVSGLAAGQIVFVSVDAGNQVSECDKSNNGDSISFAPGNVLAQIAVATDAASYGANAIAQMTATVTNTGSFSEHLTADLRIEDANGNVVADLGAQDLGLIQSGVSVDLSRNWSVGSTPAGGYVLDGLLYSADGSLLSEQKKAFTIAGGGNTAVTLRVSTDKPNYSTTDQANIGDLVHDVSVNTLINSAALQLQVISPAGSVVYSQSTALGQLTPGLQRQLSNLYGFSAAAQGKYTVNASVVDGSNNVLATASTTYIVQENGTLTISGTEAVASAAINQSDAESCTDGISNRGTQTISNLPLQQLVINLDTGATDSQTSATISLAAGASQSLPRSFATTSLAVGHHACVIQAQINGSWQPLANAIFTVNPAPVRITGTEAVQNAALNQGDAELCNETVTNSGSGTSTNLPLQQVVLNTDAGTTDSTTSLTATLAPGATQSLSRSIDTTKLAVGNHACAIQAQVNGSWQTLATAAFKVNAVKVTGTETVQTATVNIGDAQSCTDTVTNAGSGNLASLALRQQVLNTDTGAVDSQTSQTASINAGATQTYTRSIDTSKLAAGNHACAIQAQVLGSWQTLATAAFKVNAVTKVTGSESVQTATLNQGDTEACTDVVTNAGSAALANLPVQQLVINTDTGATDQQASTTATLAVGASQSFVRTFSTSALAVGHHTCVVNAQVNGAWQQLGTAAFTVNPPPVKVEGSMTAGTRGRLLVLMDNTTGTGGGCGGGSGNICNSGLLDLGLKAGFSPTLTSGTAVKVTLLDSTGHALDTETATIGSFTGTVNAQKATKVDLSITSLTAQELIVQLNGNSKAFDGSYRLQVTAGTTIVLDTGTVSFTCTNLSAANATIGAFAVVSFNTTSGTSPHTQGETLTLAQQQAWLTAFLTQEGWSFDIVSDPTVFTTKMRTGAYTTYALFAASQPMQQQADEELRELINSGEGLYMTNWPDPNHSVLDTIVGVQASGQQACPTGVQMQTNNVFGLSGQATFTQHQPVQYFTLKGSTLDGTVMSSCSTKSNNLVTHSAYGNGLSAFAGYAVLPEASVAQGTNLLADLIRKPLLYVSPPQSTALAGRVVPVHLTVTNDGVANTTAVTIGSSLGGYIVASNTGTVSKGQLTASLTLPQGQSQGIDLWVQLPSVGPVTLTATLTASANGVKASPVPVTYTISPTVKPGLNQAITDLTTYVNQQGKNCNSGSKQALNFLQQADQQLARGNVQTALSQLIQATDQLMSDPSSTVKPIRLEIDESIYEVEQLQ